MMHERPAIDDNGYLERLGDLVRHYRRNNNWSRKKLAARSGISERFLAQLETGTGNISVVRLRHIAEALQIPLSAILAKAENSSGNQWPNRIALLGLRGAGKSTLGQLAADRLNVPFVELTARIEERTGLGSAEIFDLYGIEGYRHLERSELEAVIDECPQCVLAAAGGISESSEAFELLLTEFFTVWLTAAPEEHMERVRAQGDLRPMQGHSQALQALKSILGSRARHYARADAILDTMGRRETASCDELVELLPAN